MIKQKKKDIVKETMQFCKNVDIARARHYNIDKLLTFEICETSFFLTKDGYMSKPENLVLTREVEKLAKVTPQVSRRPENNLVEVTVIDFMAYARSVPIKKKRLKTFGDFAKDL